MSWWLIVLAILGFVEIIADFNRKKEISLVELGMSCTCLVLGMGWATV